MMNGRTIIVVVLALVFGGSAAMGVNLLRSKPAEAKVVVETQTILVAAVEIPRGATFQAELVTAKEWPANLMPLGAISNLDDVVDRVALTPFFPGEPVLGAKISEEGVGASSLVRPGMRAYTIQTPTVQAGVAGFVLPGNRVDVLLTVTSNSREDETGGGMTTTLLQNVEVLAADGRLNQMDKQEKGKQVLKSVTLQVTPEMAAKLTLAQTAGSLHLSLRNDTDDDIADTSPVTMKELRYLEESMDTLQPGHGQETSDAEPVQLVSTSKTPPLGPLLIQTFRGNNGGVVHIPRQ